MFTTAMENLPEQVSITPMKAITIDGCASNGKYSGMTGMYGFASLHSKGTVIPADAWFNVGTDNEKLYISALCETGPNGILQRARKGAVGTKAFFDDSFEFVVVPNPEAEPPDVFHLIINNKGGYLAECQKNGNPVAWQPNFISNGTVKDGKWCFEIAFPLKEFGIHEFKEGQKIGIRICRNWRRMDKKYGGEEGMQSCWSHLEGAFFSVDGLPILIYKKQAPVIRMLSITTDEKPDMKLSLYNPTDAPIALAVHYVHQPQNSQSADQTTNIRLEPKQEKIMPLPIQQVSGNETVMTALEILDANKQEVLYRRVLRWSLPKPNIFAADKADADRISLKYAYYPSNNQMYILLDTSALPDQNQIKKINAVVTDKAGQEIIATQLNMPENDRSETMLQLPDLKKHTLEKNRDGDYALTVSIDGIPDSKITKKFQRKVFEWEGNQLGKSDRILPKFTPIKVVGQQVSMVLRTYTMNNLGLFSQIHADGDNLLKGKGIIMQAVINGSTIDATGSSLAFTQKTDTFASANAQWKAGALEADAVCEWDYDGVMKYTMTLKPFAGTVDSLRLIIPMDSANAYLFHPVTDGLRINYGGATPEKWTSTNAARVETPGDFVHYIWLGTEGRGLSVFGESDKGWVHAKGVPSQELYKQDGITYLVYNLISAPTTIDTERSIILCFQATPIKPMDANWRLQAGWGTPGKAEKHLDYAMNFLGSSYCQGGVSASDDLFPRDFDFTIWNMYAQIRKTGVIPEGFIEKWCEGYTHASDEMKKTYKAEIGYGSRVMKNAKPDTITFYTNGRGMRTDIDEAMTFMDDWFREEFQGQRDRKPEYCFSLSYSVDPLESYRDFALYWYKQMLSIGITDNLYWDDVFLAPNIDHTGRDGAYRMEDGNTMPSVGLWNIRELIRRAGNLEMELGKTPRNMVHMTNAAIAPICSFAQQNLDWEDNRGLRPFQQRYTKEYIRTLSIGRQFGNLPVALGLVINEGDPKEIEWCLRTGAGVCLTHEVNWTKGDDAKVYWDIRTDLLEFGYGRPETQVWNYWDKDYPLSINGDSSSIVVSKPGEARIIICNYGDYTDFAVKLDLSKLGLKGNCEVVNGENKSPLKMVDNTLSFGLKKHDFIYLIVKDK